MSPNPNITTLPELLEAMWVRDFLSRKTGASLFIFLDRDHGTLRQDFDSGKGSSNAFWNEYADVDLHVCMSAVAEKYVVKKPIMGGVEETEFVLTEDKQLLQEIKEIIATYRKEKEGE
jgi:hypothetical protein